MKISFCSRLLNFNIILFWGQRKYENLFLRTSFKSKVRKWVPDENLWLQSISHRKDLEFSKSSIWKKNWSNKDFGAERTWTGDHSLKNLRSIHLGYLRVDECRWKKNRWNHFGDCHRLPVPGLRLQAFATHRHKVFVSPFSSRETVVSELIFLGKDSYFPRPRKYRLDYFPCHIDLCCASVNM